MFINFFNSRQCLEIINCSIFLFYGEQHKIHGNEFILSETAKTNNEMMAMAKSFDVITILIICRQDYRKEKRKRGF